MRLTISCSLCVGLLSLLLSVSILAYESPISITGVTTVDAYQAKGLYDRGAVFIDVRTEEEWAIGHIDGALHLDFQQDFGKLYHAKGIEKDTPLVIYCNSVDCLRSAYACSVSIFWGFTQVYYFRSGYFAWVLQDFPAVMGLTEQLANR